MAPSVLVLLDSYNWIQLRVLGSATVELGLVLLLVMMIIQIVFLSFWPILIGLSRVHDRVKYFEMFTIVYSNKKDTSKTFKKVYSLKLSMVYYNFSTQEAE